MGRSFCDKKLTSNSKEDAKSVCKKSCGFCPTPAPVASASPTKEPSAESPSASPEAPTKFPTKSPTAVPTSEPTKNPTASPTKFPTASPTKNPTASPIEPTCEDDVDSAEEKISIIFTTESLTCAQIKEQEKCGKRLSG